MGESAAFDESEEEPDADASSRVMAETEILCRLEVGSDWKWVCFLVTSGCVQSAIVGGLMQYLLLAFLLVSDIYLRSVWFWAGGAHVSITIVTMTVLAIRSCTACFNIDHS